MKFPLDFKEPEPIHLDVLDCCVELEASCDKVEMNVTEAIFLPKEDDKYDGPYVVTPTEGTQVLFTMDKKMLSDVTINPIPTNYGLITWDGAVITVS